MQHTPTTLADFPEPSLGLSEYLYFFVCDSPRESHTKKMDRRVSIVVRISAAGESPEEAVKSILVNKAYFRDFHLVKFGHSTKEVFYPEWPAHLAQLKADGLEPIWHSTLDLSLVKTQCIFSAAPDLDFKDGAIKQLLTDIEKNPHCENFAVTSLTYVLQDQQGHDVRLFIEGMLTYGFLLVIMMLDMMRNIISGFQHHKTTDLRARLVLETYPARRRLAHSWSLLWWFRTGICASRSGGGACIQAPAQKDQGFTFVLRTIKTHNKMGAGMWVFGYMFYYFLFAWPFWNYFIRREFFLAAWITRDITSILWLGAHLLHFAVVCYTYYLKMDLPYKIMAPVFLIGYIAFLTLSPVLFVYGRFHVAKPQRVKNVVEELPAQPGVLQQQEK